MAQALRCDTLLAWKEVSRSNAIKITPIISVNNCVATAKHFERRVYMDYRLKLFAIVVTLGISSTQLLSCSVQHATESDNKPVVTKASPQFGDWGVDLSGMDKTVQPGDDFYSYVNGVWHANAVIPADKRDTAAFTNLQDIAYEQVKKMIEDIAANKDIQAGSDRQKIRDWYLSLMDESKIESLGLQPIQKDLDNISAVSDRDALADMLAENLSGVGGAPLKVGFEFDPKHTNKALTAISTGGMSLPARELYLEANYEQVRKAYREHVTRLFLLANMSNADKRAVNVLKLETEIAKFTWSLADQRNPRKKFNPTPTAQLTAIAPGINWQRFLSLAGVGSPDIVDMTTKSSVVGMTKLIATAPMDQWRDYLSYHLLTNVYVALPKAYRNEIFSFYGKTLRGQQEPDPRWRDAIADMGGVGRPLVDPLGKEFVDRYIAPESRPQLRKIVKNLLLAFDERLKNLEWMTQETRQEARDKLAKTTIKVIYPDLWQDADGLDVVHGEAVGNLRRAAVFLHKREMAYLQTLPDRRLFLKPIFEVNAYANPDWNEIVFLAAIVRPPFFDPAADPAVNYGAIGAVIGHEVSHLFDDQGRVYDGDGLLRDWWKPEDAKQFIQVTDQLAEQMSTYEPLPGKHIDGRLTLGESIADVAGLTVAYDAYKLSLNGKPAPLLDGYTGEQRFFLAYAQMWRWKPRDAYLDQLLKMDPHPPTNLRPQTVRNLDAWYEAFNVKASDKLYLTPKQRVNPW